MHLKTWTTSFLLFFKEALRNNEAGDLSLLYALLKTNIRNIELEEDI